MPDPVDFLTAGGDILGGVGGLISGLDEQSAFNYNAGILQEQADQVLNSEALSKYEFGKQEDVFLGKQQTEYAAAGVTMAGSPTDTMLQSAANFELDKQVMDYNAAIKSKGLRSEASMQQLYGREAATKGIADLGQSLLKGATALF